MGEFDPQDPVEAAIGADRAPAVDWVGELRKQLAKATNVPVSLLGGPTAFEVLASKGFVEELDAAAFGVPVVEDPRIESDAVYVLSGAPLLRYELEPASFDPYAAEMPFSWRMEFGLPTVSRRKFELELERQHAAVMRALDAPLFTRRWFRSLGAAVRHGAKASWYEHAHPEAVETWADPRSLAKITGLL